MQGRGGWDEERRGGARSVGTLARCPQQELPGTAGDAPVPPTAGAMAPALPSPIVGSSTAIASIRSRPSRATASAYPGSPEAAWHQHNSRLSRNQAPILTIRTRPSPALRLVAETAAGRPGPGSAAAVEPWSPEAYRREPAMITGISIVAVPVDDIDEALRFYCDVLGMEKRKDLSRPLHRGRTARIARRALPLHPLRPRAGKGHDWRVPPRRA